MPQQIEHRPSYGGDGLEELILVGAAPIPTHDAVVASRAARVLPTCPRGCVVGGEAGGTAALIRQNLVSHFRGIEFKPIEVHIEGLKRSAAIPDILAFEIEGVAFRSGQPLPIDNTAHPANRHLALARSKETHVKGFDLDLVGKGNNGHYAPCAWTA
jgi:hypothetical protein